MKPSLPTHRSAQGITAQPARRLTLPDTRGTMRGCHVSWGGSSAGRALRSQCRGREFDPPPLHQCQTINRPTWPVFCWRSGKCRPLRLMVSSLTIRLSTASDCAAFVGRFLAPAKQRFSPEYSQREAAVALLWTAALRAALDALCSSSPLSSGRQDRQHARAAGVGGESLARRCARSSRCSDKRRAATSDRVQRLRLDLGASVREEDGAGDLRIHRSRHPSTWTSTGRPRGPDEVGSGCIHATLLSSRPIFTPAQLR